MISKTEFYIMLNGAHGIPVGALIEEPNDNTVPCDGRELSRTEYTSLFAVLGTTYGSGDDTTAFNVPDMRGRVAVACVGPDCPHH